MPVASSDLSVRLKSVTAGYAREAPVFEAATLDLRGPALVRVHGPNGGGKSTLIELLAGYLRPREGDVLVNGHPASSPTAHARRRVCRTEPALYPMMSVHDHLVFASRWVGADPAVGLRRAERYGLGPWMDMPAESLSTGNRRRLWIVQCTLGEFDTVILDEPFNGLDDDSLAVLLDELTTWGRKSLVVVIAHQPPAGLCADRVVAWPPAPHLQDTVGHVADAHEQGERP
ncbi:MAG: ATP-binding cassette domain-containing protein [Micrococcus sp.]|nr:ATP-binding cassette domain-containing protein [Micrococcus sp.]